MRSALLIASTAAAVACSDPPCEAVAPLPECANCGLGQLRRGLTFSGDGTIWALPDGGVARAGCGLVTYFDGELHERARGEEAVFYLSFGAGPNGAGYGRAGDELLAFSGDGDIRWRMPVATPPPQLTGSANRLSVGVVASGPYLLGPEYVVIDGQRFDRYPTIALDAAGTVRWSWPGVPLSGRPALRGFADDGAGGDVVLRDVMASIDLMGLDGTGEPRWRFSFASDVSVGLAPDPEGGFYLYGRFPGVELALPGWTLPAAPDHTFLASLDAGGTVRWAVTLDDSIELSQVVDLGTEVAIAGRYQGDAFGMPSTYSVDNTPDLFVAVVGPAGVIRAHAFPGHGGQYFRAAGRGASGELWVHLDVAGGGAADSLGDFEVGGVRVSHQGEVLVSLVP